MQAIHCDVVVCGGGAAGLWILDELTRLGRAAVLLESHSLGRGQTIASQGIIHGGLKYSLSGMLHPASKAIRDMPGTWRDAEAGRRGPDLRGMLVRAECCHLWRTASVRARAGLTLARAGLRTKPQRLSAADYPAALAGCPGEVFQLPEQVIDLGSFAACLAEPHSSRIVKVEPDSFEAERSAAGEVVSVTVRCESAGAPLRFVARAIVLAAGEGNAALQQRCGLTRPAMQRRPLHMVMARGPLPELNGHCIDGATPRVTITTPVHRPGETVWQVGGRIAEQGVSVDDNDLIRGADRELRDVLPGVDFSGVEWATYRVDRAEPATQGGARPNEAFAIRQGNVVTAWPTKLALAPALSGRVCELVDGLLPRDGDAAARQPVSVDGPRPSVARPPWEANATWRRAD